MECGLVSCQTKQISLAWKFVHEHLSLNICIHRLLMHGFKTRPNKSRSGILFIFIPNK
uniref:Uncharacterized protein n=1 Tax=Rhizophora mucronata TaxID=61149 RepID=A0A2P2NPY9_RHIMU